MKKKYCDVGQHECDKLFHARTKERLSSCPLHAPRTPIKKGTPIGEYIMTSNKPRTEAKKPRGDKSIKELKELAQIVVNRYVKKLYTEYDGTAKCFTCDQWFSAKEMDASHLISVSHQSTRYDLDNLRLCCINCNRLEYGNLKTYKQALIIELGTDHVEALYARSKEIKKWTREELLEIIQKYK